MDTRLDAHVMSNGLARSGTVGVLGSGLECMALATRLATPERRVIIYPAAAAGTPVPKHCEYAITPADVAYACDAVLSTIEDTARLRDVLLGSTDRPGLALDMNPGGTIIDFGVRPPRECQAMMGVLGMRGISLIDAAIVGTTGSVLAGTATILTGGFPDAVDAVLPLLTCLGRVERTGPLGSAHTGAALMGYMEAAHMIARDEASRIGAALGLNGTTIQRLIEAEPDTTNVVAFARRADLAGVLAAERGISAEVIDLTLRKLHQPKPESS